MKAVVVTPGQKNSLKLIDMPVPDMANDDVLVKTLTVGIDATDLEINAGIYGESPKGQNNLVPGHEAVGQVVTVSKNVKSMQKGDLVVPLVRSGCGNCAPCANDEPDMCQTGQFTERGIKGANGFLSDYFTEKESNLIKIPSRLTPFATLVEPLSVSEKGIEQCFRIQERFHWQPKSAVVFGAGSLGILTTLSLRAKNLKVSVFDIEDEQGPKAILAKELGANYIDGNRIPIKKLDNYLNRPDMVFDATGNSKVAFDAVGRLDKNGIACLLGITSSNRKNEICTDCINDQLVMNNNAIFGSVSSNKRHFSKSLNTLNNALKDWPVALNSIITNRFSINDYIKAFNKASEIKNVVDMSFDEL